MYNDIQRFTESDRNILTEDDGYKKYFLYLKNILEKVIDADIDLPWDKDEKVLLQNFLRRFLNTVECFKMKYLFDSERKMKIDQSDSSFPYCIEFRYLLADTEHATERLEKIRSSEALLKDLVEWTYIHRKAPVQIQNELALRMYYEKLQKPDELFFGFTPGSLTQIADAASGKRYRFIYEWATYEASINVPVLYQLMFETDIEARDVHPSNIEWYRDLKATIEKATNIFLPLQEMAVTLDQACCTIYPKQLKRIIVGPLKGRYSLDDNPVSELLRTLDEPDAFALEVQRESIKSGGEKMRKLVSAKNSYQVFEVSHLSDETLLRKVTDYNALLFIPHATGQQLLNAQGALEYIREFKLISL
ncbi:MAG TPA: hypothetical protein VE978_11660 [Chitinophagales bacterium]|nr:hypothetical protein [Chitinophagales bacterium]